MRVYIISRAIESVKLTDISMTEINRASHAMFSFKVFILSFDGFRFVDKGHSSYRKRSRKDT